MAIVLNSYDVCVPGYERLRRNSEFILAIPVGPNDTRHDVYQALLDDVQACERPDQFDWDGCRQMLADAFGNPDRFNEQFDGTLPECDDNDDSCYLYLYCEQVDSSD